MVIGQRRARRSLEIVPSAFGGPAPDLSGDAFPTMPAMPRPRDNPAAPPLRGPLPVLPLALVAAALVAGLLAVQAQAGSGVYAALALLLSAAACAFAGAAWAGERHARRLHEARQAHHALLQLTDDWVWQTDADHRLVRMQPPQAAPASAWAAGAGRGQLLWERFEDAEHTLQERLKAQAVLPALQVLPAAAPAGEAAAPRQAGDSAGTRQTAGWQLRGVPRFDHQGVFCGYLGIARPAGPAADTGATAAAAPDEEPDSTAAELLAAEHASFSYTVSHDLRAPIRVVEGFARILKEDYGRLLDRIGNDHLDRVLSAAARMNSMIDALLSLSQLSTQPLQRQPVNLSQLALYVIDDLRRASPERDVVLHVQPGLVTQGDPTLLRMALENLLGNAWKYSARNPHAQIAFERVDEHGRGAYVVRDNGAGFDMRFADRLFGVFQRLHSSGEFPGTGVGLASVRRIIRRHGGEIWAESEVGHGARFYFTLK
jgi:signal transduction histidine kinase